MIYITLPSDDHALSCIVLTGHFCRLNTTLHPVHETQNCICFLFKDDKEKILKHGRISLPNETVD